MGRWVKDLGPGASVPANYFSVYVFLSSLILLSLLGLPCLHAIRKREAAGIASHAAPPPHPVMRSPESS
jgi:hypothetical protein